MADGMSIAVKDLSVTVKGANKQSKDLLRDVTFAVEPGDVVALMGPSGAGKTTLLNRLVGRGISGEVVGDILYSGAPLAAVRSRIGYVTQDDIMYETLTPRENLGYAAMFLQSNRSAAQRTEAVGDVMRKLRLEKCADTVVGIPGLVKGISGGERKRTNVAMSLLGQPQLLLLDEPTSGLDATMALELMNDVGEVAKQGCTVVATIHQPSEAVFEAFSKVLLLESGRLAYFGPVEQLRSKLQGLGFNISEHKPLPEVLLEVLEAPAEGAKEHRERLVALRGSGIAPSTAWNSQASQPAEQSVTRLGFCGQLLTLVKRQVRALRRNKTLTVVRMGQTILSAILIGWVFAQLDNDLGGVNSRMFVAFFLVFAQLLFATLGVVNTFPAERAVFLREAQDRWYHPAAFYLSKVVIDTLMQSFFPIFAVLIAYFLIGLNTDKAERVVLFYLIMAICSNCGAAIGFTVSAGVSSVTTALSIVPGLIMPQLLLSGLFIRIDDLPQPFNALSYLVIARYATQATVTNEFTCDTDPACTVEWHQKSDCDNSPCDFCCTNEERALSGGFCPVLTCSDALTFIGWDASRFWPSGETLTETIWYNILLLVALLVLFRLLGLVVLMLAYRRAAKAG